MAVLGLNQSSTHGPFIPALNVGLASGAGPIEPQSRPDENELVC